LDQVYQIAMRLPHRNIKYIIGIDEVGRGPVAGGVAVGAVLLPLSFTKRHFRGVRDSKKLTAKARNEWFENIKSKKKNGSLNYAVSFTGHNRVDRVGIARAVRSALNRALVRLDANPRECLILLDGGLRAPEEFIFQKTIIRGDQKEFVIALASIVAKVTRDRRMVRISKTYPEYGFELHKGYGTKLHYNKIKKHGMCDIHRRSFLKRFDNGIS
tara:strand:- start:26324 stop:26965 length:642 start_codon:yes stop_codon:yes gene_type:complete